MVFLWCRGCARKGWQFLKEECNKVIKGFIEKLTWDPNLRSGSILAVLIHSLLRSPAKISLFVSPYPLECYLQRETKIEPDLKLFKSLFNSKFLQTLIEHCLPLLFCQRLQLTKKHAGHFLRVWATCGVPCICISLYHKSSINPQPLPNKPPPPFQGKKVINPSLSFKPPLPSAFILK